jgi:hypothetical protein
MAKRNEIKGLSKVVSNLNKEIRNIQGRSMAGLIDAAIIIRRDMDKTPPLIPIDTGNLRASWTTSPIKRLGLIGLVIGFTANYAVFVHELLASKNKKVNWNRPNSGPKFFQKAIERNAKNIINVIRNRVKIKQ